MSTVVLFEFSLELIDCVPGEGVGEAGVVGPDEGARLVHVRAHLEILKYTVCSIIKRPHIKCCSLSLLLSFSEIKQFVIQSL